jgi:hypothetical protein
VSGHVRKYRDKVSRPLPIWNGIFEHYDRIGAALWEFLWCIDAITREKDGIGLVLGGSPVKLKRIIADLKADKETVRRHLKKLVDENYIRVRRTPCGQIIEVLNSKKFEIWKREKSQNAVSLPREKLIHEPEKLKFEPVKPQNAVSKEDAAVTQHKDAASAAAAPGAENPWKVIGSDIPMGSPRFQKLFEHYFATRNGNALSEVMERTIQAANVRDVKVPPPFFEAKREVERREIEELASPAGVDIPTLEAEPWAR